ncbi:unknown protein [Seminavis robusta]|uniref:Uncharacterized protein n=1 Tax=Seminavis robusta TaxID=568900 RepID=A0A9N8F1T8_9STRA|nr:unknown protein [Seminavis robusta]|eukprot:Sro3200_g345090.1 n/a (96) ;mRNA; r:6823-7110
MFPSWSARIGTLDERAQEKQRKITRANERLADLKRQKVDKDTLIQQTETIDLLEEEKVKTDLLIREYDEIDQLVAAKLKEYKSGLPAMAGVKRKK